MNMNTQLAQGHVIEGLGIENNGGHDWERESMTFSAFQIQVAAASWSWVQSNQWTIYQNKWLEWMEMYNYT